MQDRLKEINKTFKKDLLPIRSKKSFNSGTLKRCIFVFLSVIIFLTFLLLFPFSHNLLKKEIIISAQGQTMGLIFSSPKPKERINLLILGIPGKGYRGENMTDTIIIINSTLGGEKPVGISIPRDLLVKFPGKNYYVKINSLFGATENKKEGMDLIKNSIREVTGLKIDYFLVFDLNSVKKIIDELGGIDVVIEKEIFDPKFPKNDDSYESFYLPRGVHHLDGETTLKYLRSRYAPDGDFARIKRQQEVINILKNKVISLNFFWDFPKILKLWKTFTDSIYTNIDITDIKYVWNLVNKTNPDMVKFDTINTENQLLIAKEMILNNEPAYVLEPKEGRENYEKIKKYIEELIKTI